MSSHSNHCEEADHDVNNEEGSAGSATDLRVIARPERSVPIVDDSDTDLITTLKRYPTAVAWSAFFSIGVIMLAFDPQLLGNLYAMPAFRHDFGYKYEGSYIISAAWQAGLSMGNPVGQTVGAVVAGIPMDAFGRKKTFIACVLGTAGCIFIQFFARSLPALFVGELLGGLTLGFYVVIAPTYASEVAPLRLRGILTSYTNLCFVVGQLIANGITAATQSLESHWAYSIPFALQWLWVLLILPVVPFAPESPWWLLRRARLDDAERSLRRLSSSSVDSKAHLDAIAKIDRMERETEAGSTYVDCFNRLNMRRTEICIGVYSIQVLSGIYLVNYGTYFFQLAGLSTKESFDMGIAFLAVGFVGTCTSWALIDRVGRRALYTIGLGILAGLQLIIGVLDCVPDYDSRKSVVWTQSSLMMVWNFFYDLSVGPICFIIICECSATRVRSKTIAVSTAVQAMLGIIMTVAIPYLINPDEANFRGKLGFFFGGLAALSWFWSFWRVPETAGRTFEELDLLFERRVPARVFKDYQIWT